MSIISDLLDDLTGSEESTGAQQTEARRDSLHRSQASAAAQQVGETIGAVTGRIISDPRGAVEDVVNDTKVAIFGHHGVHPLTDAVNFVKGAVDVTRDAALNIFNLFPAGTTDVGQTRYKNAVSAAEGATVTSAFTTGPSLGDMSWLIYRGRLVSNPEMMSKWQLYRDDETTHGFNSRTYVNEADKQVVITLEGTQANSDLSPLWLSKDGLADAEIGAGVIPPQMREGYEEFKNIVADVMGNYVDNGYSFSVAGHSLGGGLAQLLPGMYYIDTGVALPTLAEAGPGMLNQLKLYAEEQLLAGKAIHLPNGEVTRLTKLTTLGRANEAKAIVSTFEAQDFSFVKNLITALDPVGAVNYNRDASKDGHIGVDMIVPYLLTTREDMQDLEASVVDSVNWKNLVTPELTERLGFGGIHATRFDRHEPDQSIALWSGTAVGYKDPSRIGVGSAVYRDYLEPRKVWSGSRLGLPEDTTFGTEKNDTIMTTDKATQVLAGAGNDTIIGGNGGNMLSGGYGDDYIVGGSGDDYLAGDEGDDSLYGQEGNDILYGGDGNDYLDGGKGDDLLFGGAGNDTLVWQEGNDILCGQEGDDTFAIRQGATGNAEIKWERNYTNFGKDNVVIEGALGEASSLNFNFADEIRVQDMRWSTDGKDIVMTDTLGNETASVTFENAYEAFAANSGNLTFQFTNGRLYKDDTHFDVQAGSGTLTATDKDGLTGSFLVGGSEDDTLVSGKGDDYMFGGSGKDTYSFAGSFGSDTIVGLDEDDYISFDDAYAESDYALSRSGSDLVISHTSGSTQLGSVTLSDWYAGHTTQNLSFAGTSYQVAGTQLKKA